MNLIIKIGLSVVALLLLSTTACKKCDDPSDPNCRNYDPCHGQAALTADIKMEEVFEGFYYSPMREKYGAFSYETDTVCRGNSVRFSALAEADRYEWRIGSDPRVWEEREFSLSFFSFSDHYGFEPTTLMVSLTTYRDNPQTCFPDDIIATNAIPLTIVPERMSRMEGDFEGQSSRFLDSTFTIRIEIDDTTGYDRVYNIPKGCVDLRLFDNTLQLGYKKAVMSRVDLNGIPEFCYAWEGVLELSDDGNRISIDYFLFNNSFFEGFLEEQNFLFEGDRL